MTKTTDSLPEYLKKVCTVQDYSLYTPRQQESWRYIMKQALPFFKEHAVSIYEEGLQKSAIYTDFIPNIAKMDDSMQSFGWGAATIQGFIPPWAFLEFQSRKILPIATDMRQISHIAYTPAPDIVHEAAGHAPILCDNDYSDYLSDYAKIGLKAIYSHEDAKLFNAIRLLSDIKEKHGSTKEEITDAETRLEEAKNSFTYISEATLFARMSWWTAEYGLVGTPENYKIYGAGLLSSIEEGRLAITDKVKKIPLSLECLNYNYNITEPQPQLFVARDMPHLHEVLDSVEKTMSYKRGGAYGLDKAKEAKATTTSVFETKLSVSGIVERYEVENSKVTFIKWMGPTQVCYDSQTLDGQGVARHPEGFSGPLGRFKGRPDKPSYNLTPGDLRSMNLIKGQRCQLELSTGFKIEGTLNDTLFIDRKLVLLSWSNCTVTKQGHIYFHPDWGEFDQFIAEDIASICGGPADRNDFPEENKAEIDSNPSRETPFSVDEINLFAEYEKLRKLRTKKKIPLKEWLTLVETNWNNYPNEWLLLLNLYEIGLLQDYKGEAGPWLEKILNRLGQLQKNDKYKLIERGLLNLRKEHTALVS